MILNNNSHIPPKLHTKYRLLKNTNYLPPKLKQQKKTIQLLNILKNIHHNNPQYQKINHRLSLLKLKLRQTKLNTDFLHDDYTDKLLNKINDN